MNILSRQWQQFWQIVKSYWLSLSFQSVAQLLLLVVFSLGSSAFIMFETLQRGEITSSLVAGNVSRFERAIWFFCSAIIINIVCSVGKNYLSAQISLNWRKWLTSDYTNQYCHNQSFYHLQRTEIDNPDQRIAEDIKNVTQRLITMLVIFLDSLVQLIGFAGLLWLISPILMGILLTYAVVGSVLTTLAFGRVLVGINLEQLKREADFRYGLVRIRDNAEAIAFYRGQEQESEQSKFRFGRVFSNINFLIRWQFNLNIFQNCYQYLTFILPFIILAPRIFSRELEVGAVTQSQAAFERVGLALGLIINQFEQLSVLAAGVKRLVELTKGIQTISQHDSNQHDSKIELIEQSHIWLDNLTLKSPQPQTNLIENLSLTILPGQSLVIIGASGVGKTTLLRAIAGLWVYGEGKIGRPLQEILFLPQRPYMPLLTLRQQLLYPHATATDQEILSTLVEVDLPNLAQLYNGLDAVADWSNVLSLGEQQRLIFARLLLNHPKYAILDEATSALDSETATHLYKKLQKTDITYISVAHRTELVAYHQFVLELKSNQWQLHSQTI